jgi:hypothetical protein
MVTLLIDDEEVAVAGAVASGEALWLSARDAEAVAGWVRKPEGLCRGEVCVPLSPGRERELVRDGQVNVAGLWRLLGRPVVHSAAGDAWVLGASAGERAAALTSLEAPDFALPDPSGRLHSVSEHRGKKVLLVTWASW